MSLTLRQLNAFKAVADAGTFTAAADRLNVAQPALSQLIKELEQVLGIRLFDRTTRRVELTDAGREFLSSSMRILADIDLAVDNAKGLAARQRGRVIVAAAPLLSAVVLPQAIVKLQERFPGIEVSVLDLGTHQIIEAVRNGTATCGLGTFTNLEADMDSSPLARDNLLLFSSAQHWIAKRSSIAWAELKAEPIIALTPTSGIRRLVEAGFEIAELPFNPAFEVNQIYTVLALVEAGLGVAVLPNYARAAAPHRSLAVCPLTDPTISRDISLVRHRSRTRSPALLALEMALRSSVQHFSKLQDKIK